MEEIQRLTKHTFGGRSISISTTITLESLVEDLKQMMVGEGNKMSQYKQKFIFINLVDFLSYFTFKYKTVPGTMHFLSMHRPGHSPQH